MLFSQRYGLKPIKTIIQIDSMDDNLRNGLWNCLVLFCLDPLGEHTNRVYGHRGGVLKGRGEQFIIRMWHEFFKKPVDLIPKGYLGVQEYIRNYYFRATWNEVYDLLEWIAKNYPFESDRVRLVTDCNETLEKEVSGYRFVSNQIVPITSEEEISAVEEALKIPDPFKGPRTQIKSALKKLSNRKSPDYAGSIKDSISAVEGILRIIAKEQVTSFDNALMWIKKRRIMDLHPALEDAFKKMYAYTSDSKQGIRHALLDEPNLAFEDAKYMLVVCSAFVNYLIAKLPGGKNNT